MARDLRTAAATLGLMLALAGCGGDDGTTAAPTPEADAPEAEVTTPPAEEPTAATPEPTSEATPQPTPEADGETPAADGEGATVAVGETDLGEVLVDGDGRTLYIFEPDEGQGPTCTDQCADAWPPLVSAVTPTAEAGVDEALLDVDERPDGGMQAAYNGWPLYRWAGDEAPGDVNGQGVNEVWWVIGPDGEPLREASPAY